MNSSCRLWVCLSAALRTVRSHTAVNKLPKLTLSIYIHTLHWQRSASLLQQTKRLNTTGEVCWGVVGFMSAGPSKPVLKKKTTDFCAVVFARRQNINEGADERMWLFTEETRRETDQNNIYNIPPLAPSDPTFTWYQEKDDPTVTHLTEKTSSVGFNE